MVSPSKVFIRENFKTIFKLFNELHTVSKTLSFLSKKYSTDDISSEIYHNKTSYPNLVNYLSVKNKPYFNLGKMTSILKLYEGADINKDLFTLHSYLRFLERYVMPELMDDSENKYITTKQIGSMYIDKLTLLKSSLQAAFRNPVDVSEYSLEEANIKAPKIFVPIQDLSGRNYEITINDQGKIHTIF